MSYRRVLEGFTPEVGTAWVTWAIQEAVTPDDAAAVTIEGPTVISPAITDVTNPPTLTLATNNATLTDGWYRVLWQDASGVQEATGWQRYRTLSPYAPTVGDIATILRARAIENGGVPVDTFTDQTNPTAQAVQHAIVMFAPLVLARLGRLDDLHCANAEDLRAAATAVVAQRVALEVEASYWAEEVNGQASIDIRRQMLDADITGLMESLTMCRSSTDDGGDGGISESRSDPAWQYPYARPLRF